MAYDSHKDGPRSETHWILCVLVGGVIGKHLEFATKDEAVKTAKTLKLIGSDKLHMSLTRIVSTEFELDLGE
jgi:hypothetical protein